MLNQESITSLLIGLARGVSEGKHTPRQLSAAGIGEIYEYTVAGQNTIKVNAPSRSIKIFTQLGDLIAEGYISEDKALDALLTETRRVVHKSNEIVDAIIQSLQVNND